MTTTEPSKTGPAFASLDPRDGTVLAKYPIAGPEEVALAVERARAAARWWAAQGPRGRREWLLEYKRAIASRAEELASLISAGWSAARARSARARSAPGRPGAPP